MMLSSSVGFEKAAKYGSCRNQPFDVGDRAESMEDVDEEGGLSGDVGALIYGSVWCTINVSCKVREKSKERETDTRVREREKKDKQSV